MCSIPFAIFLYKIKKQFHIKRFMLVSLVAVFKVAIWKMLKKKRINPSLIRLKSRHVLLLFLTPE